MSENKRFQKDNVLLYFLKDSRFYYPIVILILSLIYYLSYANYGIIEGDWGSILIGAEHFLEGKVFYKDFSIIYTPGIYIYTAFFFKLLGISLSSAMIGWSILRVFNCVIIYLIGINLVSRQVALILPLLLWFVPGTLHKSFFVFFMLLDIFLLIKILSTKNKLLYFVSGIIASITLLFRVDLFGFFLITFVFIEFLKLISSNKKKSVILNLLLESFLMSCGIVAGSILFIFYLFSNSALISAYEQTKGYSTAMKSLWFALPPISEVFSFNTLAINKYIGVFTPLFLYFLIGVIIVLILKEKDYRLINEQDKNFLVILLFGGMTINQTLMYPNVARVSVILSPLLITTLYLTVRYMKRKNNYSTQTRLIYSVSLMGLIFTTLSYITLSCIMSDVFINGSYFIRFSNTAFLSEPRLKVYTTPEYAEKFKKVESILKTLTKKNEYIFNFPGSYQIYHFVTERKAIEKYSLIGEYLKSEDRQKEVIRQLKEKDVRVIIAELEWEVQKREKWAPLLNQYIMKYYEPKYTINSFSILVRK